MPVMTAPHTSSPLKAPAHDGGVLIAPPLAEVASLLHDNRLRLSELAAWSGDLDFAAYRQAARAEIVQAAYDYTRQYADVPAPQLDPAAPLFVSGHQPQLFHPGVWYKNFLLSKLADAHGGLSLNLVIDSDVARSVAIAVPSGSVDSPRLESVPFDRPTMQVPFEERTIADRGLFDSFGKRAAAAIAPLVPDPYVRQYWPLAVAQANAGQHLGLALSQSRHQQEIAWGSTNYELPQSRLCRTNAYRQFIWQLIGQARLLAEHYNAAVEAYRRTGRIRNAAHPVPNLLIDDDGVELPLWLWTAEMPERRRVFIERRGSDLTLTDRQQIRLTLSTAQHGSTATATEQLADWEAQGIKLRTRALANTLFARLAFADLFVHGIGGAKYDHVTDTIIGGLLGIEPPHYLTATATLRLPVPRPGVSTEDTRLLAQRLRELEFHAERWISDDDAPAQQLAAEKRRLIALPISPKAARPRCQAIRAVNQALQPHVANLRNELLTERSQLQDLLRTEKLLASREYAFCLYPAEQLQTLMASRKR
jgi:hypothetical protein